VSFFSSVSASSASSFKALCRAELLIEQIIRIDPKSIQQTHAYENDPGLVRSQYHLLSNNKRMTIPASQFLSDGEAFERRTPNENALRAQSRLLSGRSSTQIAQEKSSFKPVVDSHLFAEQEILSRFTPVHRPTTQYPASNALLPVGVRHRSFELIH
jgi:hypothetical protein